MNDSLVPETLDIRKAFTGEMVVEGVWPVSRMSRLQDRLNSERGEARVRLTLSRDADWRRIIRGEVSVTVDVVCERCLDNFPLSLSEPVLLAVVESEGLAERLPEEIEPWLTDAVWISIPEIVEEQLILAMPIVALHGNPDCMPDEQRQAVRRVAREPGREKEMEGSKGTTADADNPFAILETLKKTDR